MGKSNTILSDILRHIEINDITKESIIDALGYTPYTPTEVDNLLSKEDYENIFMFCENVGFEEHYISYADYKEYIRKYKIHNFVETEYIIEKQRMIKDEEEIENVKEQMIAINIY